MGVIWVIYGEFSDIYLFSGLYFPREHLMRMEHLTLNVSPVSDGSGEGNAEENIREAPLQEIDLSALNEYPVEVKEDQKTRSILIKIKNSPAVRRGALIGAGIMAWASTVTPVAADAMNWTMITEMFDGVAGLMPSVSNLIIAVVPVIIVLVVVGFLTGLLDGIVDSIKSAMTMMKR